MIKETGRVVAIDSGFLWLETINRGTCGSCAAENGCGQSLLARWLSSSHYLKVGLDGRDPNSFHIDDEICIGIPENVVVVSSLLIYCLPLLGLIVGAAFGQTGYGTDLAATIGAIGGLVVSAMLVRVYTWYQRNNGTLRPVIVDPIMT